MGLERQEAGLGLHQVNNWTSGGVPMTLANLIVTLANLPMTLANLPMTLANLPMTLANLPMTLTDTPSDDVRCRRIHETVVLELTRINDGDGTLSGLYKSMGSNTGFLNKRNIDTQ